MTCDGSVQLVGLRVSSNSPCPECIRARAISSSKGTGRRKSICCRGQASGGWAGASDTPPDHRPCRPCHLLGHSQTIGVSSKISCARSPIQHMASLCPCGRGPRHPHRHDPRHNCNRVGLRVPLAPSRSEALSSRPGGASFASVPRRSSAVACSRCLCDSRAPRRTCLARFVVA